MCGALRAQQMDVQDGMSAHYWVENGVSLDMDGGRIRPAEGSASGHYSMLSEIIKLNRD